MSTDLPQADAAMLAETANGQQITLREIAAVVFWTILADLLIFRSEGFSGPALFLSVAPVLLLIGSRQARTRPALVWLILLMLLVAGRLVWAGSVWTVLSGVVLLVAIAMSTAGQVPYVLEGFVVAARIVYDGLQRLSAYGHTAEVRRDAHRHGAKFALILPLLVTSTFAGLFAVANPDLLNAIRRKTTMFADQVFAWFHGVSIYEFPFCLLALVIGAGLMRPALPLLRIGRIDERGVTTANKPSPMYAAYRNTLVTLIGLFAVYLAYEFITLWKRDFPDNFYYAGYAHQGAFWLTVALLLATVVLSVVFGGSILGDPRMSRLRKLAWLWSLQNGLLAAAVYNRLLIYIGYNGMTRMRMIGLFGITLVVIGFALVIYKLATLRGFWWLIHAQLTALMLMILIYTITPVDYWVHRYNVSRIDDGYFPPSVMIAAKPIADEGYLTLLSLKDCPNDTIRRGVLALLAHRQAELDRESITHWSGFQGSTAWLRRRLTEEQSAWNEFKNPRRRAQAVMRFRRYAQPWY